MARAVGDAAAAREDLRRVLEHEVGPIPRYSWQLVWLGLRVEAEAPEPAPERVAALEALSRELSAATPPALAYRALAAAESARLADHEANWSEAIDATRTAGDPYLVAYALLRHAEVACEAADRESASAAVQEAARLAAALGAAPLLADVTGLARRARVRIEADAPAAEPGGTGIDAFGLTQREREVLELLADGRSGSVAAALLLAACIGAGQFTTEVVSDTTLQRSLDPAVFARAYGLVVPASVAGIALGALLAPPCVALIGLDGALALTGALVLGYGAVAFLRPAPAPVLETA